jgi:hypothetical protein
VELPVVLDQELRSRSVEKIDQSNVQRGWTVKNGKMRRKEEGKVCRK